MSYRGHIKNGSVVLDAPVELPEGSEVLIQEVEPPASLASLFRDVACQGKDLPVDGSVRHDDYIYGTPKR